MERHELQELHYITPIDNVPLILRHGILSYAEASRVAHISVAMPEIQKLRASKVVPGGKKLHEYANLYICARNPMLYKRRAECDKLCVLVVSPDILDRDGVIITDSNASSQYARFAPAPDGLRIVSREWTFAEYWTQGDQRDQWQRKSAKNAEVLVPDRVDPEFIKGAYVGSEIAKKAIEQLAPQLPVSLDCRLFFL